MGIAKSELMRQEALRAQAEEVAAEGGALTPCEFHGDNLLDKGAGAGAAHALAKAMAKRGELNVPLNDFVALIDEVVEEAPDECFDCARWRDSD